MINLKNTKVGRFITFEGGEGGGKSTQTRLLQDSLTSIGVESILTREPGGSVGAEEIRELIVSGSSDRWDSLTELCLLYAARRDHWLKLIKPNLEQGIWVISDRFADSSIVYQGYAGDIELDTVLNIHNVINVILQIIQKTRVLKSVSYNFISCLEKVFNTFKASHLTGFVLLMELRRL